MLYPDVLSSEKYSRNNILEVPISSIDMGDALSALMSWIGSGIPRYICVADVNSVMVARRDKVHFAALNGAALITPDGVPLVWLSKLCGDKHIRRVCGPDLLPAACGFGISHGWRHFFLGGRPGVADELARVLRASYPDLLVCGCFSPSFGDETAVQTEEILTKIKLSQADIVWVGLGCPKQERWMMLNSAYLPDQLLVGVGAAFDFRSNSVARAPLILQRSGLEWLFRLASDPKRLWKRYLISAPIFAILAAKQFALSRRAILKWR